MRVVWYVNLIVLSALLSMLATMATAFGTRSRPRAEMKQLTRMADANQEQEKPAVRLIFWVEYLAEDSAKHLAVEEAVEEAVEATAEEAVGEAVEEVVEATAEEAVAVEVSSVEPLMVFDNF
ncbi:hypothetical protein ACLKA6_000473 [Drosophila palustris]